LEARFLLFGVFTVFAELAKVCEINIPSLRKDVWDAKTYAAPFGALVAQLAKWLVTLENTKRTQEFAVLRLATRQAHLLPCKDSSMFLVAEFLCPFQYNYFKSMQI